MHLHELTTVRIDKALSRWLKGPARHHVGKAPITPIFKDQSDQNDSGDNGKRDSHPMRYKINDDQSGEQNRYDDNECLAEHRD